MMNKLMNTLDLLGYVLFTYSSEFNQRVVRKHPIFWKIHDCMISCTFLIAFLFIAGAAGGLETSTNVGIAFLHDILRFIMYFLFGGALILLIAHYNEFFYEDEDDDIMECEEDDAYTTIYEVDLPNNYLRHVQVKKHK